MPTQAYRGTQLGKALIAEGVCPSNATNVVLTVPVDGPVTLHYDVLVDPNDVPKIVRALSSLLVAERTEPRAAWVDSPPEAPPS